MQKRSGSFLTFLPKTSTPSSYSGLGDRRESKSPSWGWGKAEARMGAARAPRMRMLVRNFILKMV